MGIADESKKEGQTMKTKCTGLLGWLLGHKYINGDGGLGPMNMASCYDNCLRCGMPEGGWPSEELRKSICEERSRR